MVPSGTVDVVCSRKYGVPVVVAINAFASDSKGEKVTMLN
jgi:formyltetrahydrofolate synthetase